MNHFNKEQYCHSYLQASPWAWLQCREEALQHGRCCCLWLHKEMQLELMVPSSVFVLHFRSLLTFSYGACSTGLGEAVALTDWTAEAHVHESLGCFRKRGTSGQHQPHPPPQQFLHLPEQQAAQTEWAIAWFWSWGKKTHYKLTRKSHKWVLTHCTEVHHSLSGSAPACNCSPLWTGSSEWNSFPVLCSSHSCWCDPWFPLGDKTINLHS